MFFKTRGRTGRLRLGDEFVVRMPGPWDGPVRVIRATPTSVRLATLRGHLEAGQIDFHARDLGEGTVEFEIESWARAADRLSHVLYNRLRLAKEIQLNLWVETCLGLAALAADIRATGCTSTPARSSSGRDEPDHRALDLRAGGVVGQVGHRAFQLAQRGQHGAALLNCSSTRGSM